MASKAKQSSGRAGGVARAAGGGALNGARHASTRGHAEGGARPSNKGDAGIRAERSEKDRKTLEKLVETGKSKGFLTYDEVNDALPADVAPDQLDDVVGALGDEDIEIVDGATQVKIAPKRIAEEEASEKKLVVAQDREEEDVDYYSK